MKKTCRPIGLLSASLLALTVSLNAHAQSSETANEAVDGATDEESISDRQLDTIVVTATKRETLLQDTPIAIGVVSGETIQDYTITDLTDLQNFAPSLTVQKTFGNWSVRVRGLGSGVTNPAFDSSVSIFNDGMYCGRSRCLEAGFMDVGGVEIARGPQGALFGKSTIAGAITVNSARPTDEWETYLTAGGELEDGGYKVNGAISGPVTEGFRVRLAGQYRNLDGDFYNAFIKQWENAVEDYSGRLSAELDLGPDTMLFGKIEGASTDISGGRGQLVSAGTLGLARSTIPASSLEINADESRLAWTGLAHGDYDRSNQASALLKLDHEFGNGHELQLLSGAWQFDYKNYLDVDGVPERVLNTSLTEDYEQKTLEARILSPDNQTLEYIAGVMYHNSITRISQNSPFFPAFFLAAGVPPTSPAFAQIPGFGTSTPGATGALRSFKRTSDTISAYGQLTWNINDRLSAIFDIRYTEEEQNGLGRAQHAVFPDGETIVFRPGAPFQAANPEFIFLQTRNDESVDPSLRLLYEWTPDANLYVAYSTGSKPGGMKANDGTLGAVLLGRSSAFKQQYVGRPTLTLADLNSGLVLAQGNGVFDFEDEQAKNFEIGIKAFLVDRTLSLNAALFHMDFENLQTSTYDGTRFIIGNAASARVRGLEMETTWNASDNLRVNGSLSLLDATYQDYTRGPCPVLANLLPDPNCVSGQADLSGRRLERTPEVEWTAGFAYDHELTDSLTLATNFDAYYSSDFFVQNNYSPLGVQDAFNKYNARIALRPDSDSWELALVGRNITDERTIQHAYVVASDFVTFGEGRKIFIEATKRW